VECFGLVVQLFISSRFVVQLIKQVEIGLYGCFHRNFTRSLTSDNYNALSHLVRDTQIDTQTQRHIACTFLFSIQVSV